MPREIKTHVDAETRKMITRLRTDFSKFESDILTFRCFDEEQGLCTTPTLLMITGMRDNLARIYAEPDLTQYQRAVIVRDVAEQFHAMCVKLAAGEFKDTPENRALGAIGVEQALDRRHSGSTFFGKGLTREQRKEQFESVRSLLAALDSGEVTLDEIKAKLDKADEAEGQA